MVNGSRSLRRHLCCLGFRERRKCCSLCFANAMAPTGNTKTSTNSWVLAWSISRLLESNQQFTCCCTRASDRSLQSSLPRASPLNRITISKKQLQPLDTKGLKVSTSKCSDHRCHIVCTKLFLTLLLPFTGQVHTEFQCLCLISVSNARIV